MLAELLFSASFALLNRARGSRFFDTLDSTTEGRVLACLCMAWLTALAAGGDHLQMAKVLGWTFASLMLWCIFGWGTYAGAAIGGRTNFMEREFPPVDWLMKQMPFFTPVYRATASDLRRRLWGAVAMGLRMTLAAPCIIGLAHLTGQPDSAWIAAGTVLLGIPYLLAGYATKSAPWACGEYGAGAALGLMILQVINV